MDTAAFMVLRSQRRQGDDVPTNADAAKSESTVAYQDMFDGEGAQLALAMLVGDCTKWTEEADDGSTLHLDDIRSGSWATIAITTGTEPGCVVRQDGPRQLWNEAETAYHWWLDQSHPSHTDFGLTVTTDGEHHVWLRDPRHIVASPHLAPSR